MADQLTRVPVLHVRFEGLSRDLALNDLDVSLHSDDDTIRRALATYLDVPVARLQNHVIDRHQTGNLTLRPEAVFG